MPTSYGGANDRNDSKGECSPIDMAEGVEIEINLPSSEHDEMPFRLGDIVLDKKFGDLHPSLRTN